MTKKQTAFINNYYKTRNAKRSAIAAGYSEKTSDQIGWNLLHKPAIRMKLKEMFSAVGQEFD